jgi:hypothetical protein
MNEVVQNGGDIDINASARCCAMFAEEIFRESSSVRVSAWQRGVTRSSISVQPSLSAF